MSKSITVFKHHLFKVPWHPRYFGIWRIIIMIFFVLALGFYSLRFVLKPENYSNLEPKNKEFVASIQAIRWQKLKKVSLHIKDLTSKKGYLLTLDKARKPFKVGDAIKVSGTLVPFEPATNPAQMNWQRFFAQKGIYGRITRATLLWHNPNKIWRFENGIQVMRVHIMTHFSNLFNAPYDTRLFALVFGTQGIRLDEEWQYYMQKMGLIHAIVVSGSQVSLLSGGLILFLRLLGFSFTLRWLLVVLLHSVFFVLVGGGAAVLRSMLMVHVMIALSRLKSHTKALYLLLSVAYMMVLISGSYVTELGAWLSFIATYSLLIWVPKLQDRVLQSWPEWLRLAVLSASVPTAASSVIIMIFKHSLMPWSFVANLLLLPLFELLVILGFLLGIFSVFFAFLSQPLAWLSLGILYACEAVVAVFSKMPFTEVSVSTAHNIFLCAVFLCYIWSRKLSNLKKVAVWAGVVLVTIVLTRWPKPLSIYVLDVGQAEAILMTTPFNKHWLIDVGYGRFSYSSFDKAVSVIVPVCRSLGIQSLEGVFLTHLDRDHAGGIVSLLKHMPVKDIYVGKQAQQNLKKMLPQLATQVLTTGDHLNLDAKTQLFVLSPDTRYSKSNNQSLVLKLSYQHFDGLLMGDAERKVERNLLLEQEEFLRGVEWLKVGHHGSLSSSIPSFLDYVKPVFATISAGRFNRYGHPKKTVLTRFQQLGTNVFRNDLHGCIRIRTNGKHIWVKPFINESL